MRNPLVEFILKTAVTYGLSRDEVLATYREQTGRAEGDRLSSDYLTPLIRAMAQVSGDPDFGLHLGESMAIQAFNPVIYLVISSVSLSRSIGAAIRFAHVLEGRASKLFTRDDPMGQLIGWKKLSPDQEDRHHHEFIAVALARGLAWIAGGPVKPVEVRFQHPSPGDTREHLRLLGRAPVFLNKGYSGLVISTSDWEQRSAHGDRGMSAMHETVLEAQQAELKEADLVQRVRREVKARIESGSALSDVSRALGMSDRSLQRKLTGLGTSFRQVVDEVRREQVMHLLRSSDMSLDAVAMMAGFSDASSLHRAFARWMGQTPQAWRDANR